jgi:endonuclease YncB( thermonuclease family)
MSRKPARVWTVPAVVVRVHDGDTFTASLDLGWRVAFETAVRIRGIDAPELPTRAGKKAAAKLAELLPVGTQIQIACKRLDLHGRSEAGVLRLADSLDVGAEMLAQNCAQIYPKRKAKK